MIVETTKVPGWEAALAAEVAERLAGIAGAPGPAQIARDIGFGARADSRWKDAMSRPFAPRELTHAEFWGDFVAADWPAAAREAVLGDAAELCRRMGHLRSDRRLRAGMDRLLDGADAAGIPVGIVSNALSGQVHLDWLAEHGMTDRFAVRIHSDDGPGPQAEPGDDPPRHRARSASSRPRPGTSVTTSTATCSAAAAPGSAATS